MFVATFVLKSYSHFWIPFLCHSIIINLFIIGRKSMGTDADKELITNAQDQSQAQYNADWNQDTEVNPHELSGDQNATQSVLVASTNGEVAKANLGLTITTIIKTVIGSGILSMPFTVSKMGWVFATMIFLGAASLAQFGSILLLKAKNLSRHSNYSTILYQIWKSKMAKGIGSLIIFLNNMGVCIAQLIIFKETIHKILGDILGEDHQVMQYFYTSQAFIVLIMAILQVPLTLAKKMEKLKFMALFGVSGIVIFMATFVFFYIESVLDTNPFNNPAGNMKAFPQDWFKACAAVPNVFFALGFQMNLFPIYKGMRKASDSRMSKAVFIAIVSCTLSYLIIGIMGYNYVGDSAYANFLNSLQYNRIAPAFFFIINAGFLLSIFFAFPIMFFGCRNNFIALIQLAMLKNKQLRAEQNWRQGDEIQHISSYILADEAVEKKKRANLHFILYTFGIYLVIVGVALGVDDIEAVFNVMGAICASSISILLPCFYYIMLMRKQGQQKTVKYYVAIAVLAVMTPYSIFSVVALYVNP